MTYRIRSGDTLSELAQKHNTTVSALAQANGIKNPNLIYAGALLRIGTASGPSKATGGAAPSSPSGGTSSGTTGTAAAGSTRGISGGAKAQMANLMRVAAAGAGGKAPGGWCLKAVQDYLAQTKYGSAGSLPRFPLARNFAEFLNRDGNAQKYGLKRLNITNPYEAPPGSIVVVRAGTPGTSHPTAGDIVVKGPGSTFYNDGMMGYGGAQNFPAGNSYVLGVYVPA